MSELARRTEIRVAVKYEEQLNELFTGIWFDEKYRWYGGECNNFEAKKSTWEIHEFVSIDSKGNVIGYIAYEVNQVCCNAYGLRIINFTDNKILFGRDLKRVLNNIFCKFNLHKLSFHVIIGNPAELSYDKLTKKYGGRVVGILHDDLKLWDGQLYDCKMYEIMREDYLVSLK